MSLRECSGNVLEMKKEFRRVNRKCFEEKGESLKLLESPGRFQIVQRTFWMVLDCSGTFQKVLENQGRFQDGSRLF
jgi:hypothetical protein